MFSCNIRSFNTMRFTVLKGGLKSTQKYLMHIYFNIVNTIMMRGGGVGFHPMTIILLFMQQLEWV